LSKEFTFQKRLNEGSISGVKPLLVLPKRIERKIPNCLCTDRKQKRKAFDLAFLYVTEN